MLVNEDTTIKESKDLITVDDFAYFSSDKKFVQIFCRKENREFLLPGHRNKIVLGTIDIRIMVKKDVRRMVKYELYTLSINFQVRQKKHLNSNFFLFVPLIVLPWPVNKNPS
jgi:hypothetical protein